MQDVRADISFKALIVSQFVGAFNDNALKMIISFLAIRILSNPDSAAQYMSIIGLIFILPFVIFGPLAGRLADRFPKRNLIIFWEGIKVVIMLLAVLAVLSNNLWAMSGVLLLSMTESAFYSPAKYGILPEILKEEELSAGNGLILMWTFSAIIAGTFVGGRLMEAFSHKVHIAVLMLVGVGILGFIASFFIRSNYRPDPKRFVQAGLLAEAWRALRQISQDRGMRLTMLALCLYSFLGAIFQMNILIYGTHVLRLTQTQSSMLLVAVSAGLAAGGLMAGKASEGKVELGLVPVGALGISVFCLILGVSGIQYYSALGALFFLGLSAGFYTVPLNAFFQRWSPLEQRGQFLAGLNLATSLSVFLAAGFVWFFAGRLGYGPAMIFVLAGVVSLVAGFYVVTVLPQALLRLLNLVIAHSVYLLKVQGGENVPEKGGALLIANHISFVDAVLIMASLKRPVRFIMNQDMYELPLINVLCRTLKVIPINKKAGPRAVVKALETAREAIQAGELICIFPEGHLTRTGNMLPFHKGFEFIMKGLDAPVIPLYLDNIWGSIFSFSDGKYFWKFPKSTRYPVSIIVGKPLPASVRVHQARIVVQELGAEANILRGAWRKKLHLAFIDEVKRHPFKFCMADSSGMRFTYPKVFALAVSLARAIFPRDRRPKESNEMVGVLLPSSCMAAVSNLAIAFAGKVPVNLNFTLSKESFDSCLKQSNMRTIITSKAFLDKVGISPLPAMVYLEDLQTKCDSVSVGLRFLAALLFPKWLLTACFIRGDKTNVDDVATVIFSSGSTGEPKGVMLSHANIFSNIESFYQIFNIRRDDVVVAALPFFHSFGFTATLCFPLGTAVAVVFHNNPLDAGTIGKLTEKYKATILMGTPTFMSAYLRKCSKEQFRTLRMAVVGAERLKETLVKEFNAKFGLIPFEGYGATELSPIVTVGFPDYSNDLTQERQVGNKFGKVGHPIPGVAVKVVDINSYEEKGVDEEGLLLVKGANVMKGYLNNPLKTAEVMRDGWYVTGDIAAIDGDGFIKITDRLSRFSKIGGEMVPHVKLEDNIKEALGIVDPVVVVTAVPDEKKGERLVVLHMVDINVEAVCDALIAQGIPNLWVPRKENFFRVDHLPLLGTGKVDLREIKIMAQELAGISESSHA